MMAGHVMYYLLLLCGGGKHVIVQRHLDSLKSGCIVCNMGHTDGEIDVVCSL